MDRIVIADKLYVPAEYLSRKKVEKRYVKSYFSDYGCRGCEYKPDRPTDNCTGCENFGGTFDFTKKILASDGEYTGLPLGDRDNIPHIFNLDYDDFEIDDRRCRAKFDYKINIDLGEDRDWFDYQDKTTEAMKKAKHGIFVLPPRSGKSLTMLRILIELGYKAIIIADQYDFLNQFIGDIEESTNLPELQERTGEKLYGFIDKPEDLDTLQIAIATWQSFISKKGKKLFKKVNKTFGAAAVDEVHTGSSPVYNNLLNRLRTFVRIGCTGTEFKKSGKHYNNFMVIGDVKSKILRAQLVAKVIVIDTQVKNKSAYAGKVGYVKMGKMLAAHKKRNQIIVEYVLKDLEAGHSIVIPLHFKEHIFDMVKAINEAVGYEVAAPFVGGGGKKNKEQRDMVKYRATKREIRVVVGIRSLLQRGINIKPWSAMYYVMPQNNEPNWKQESSRILTPDKDKRQPIIRLFADSGCNASLKYLRHTWNHTLKFNHEPTELARERYREIMKKLAVDISEDAGMDDYDQNTEAVRLVPSGGLFGGISR